MRAEPTQAPKTREWILRAAAVIGMIAVAGSAVSAETVKPSRIVSLNPCTDQLVWMLADRNRIVSLSHLAADPQVSMIAKEVDVAHLNHGEAEEVLPLNPDLVLNGPFSHRAATLLLRRLGYRVIEVEAANSVADIRRHIRELGQILGTEDRAEEVIARMDARLAQLAPRPGEPSPSAINYQPNGFTAGNGTLIADVLRHAGFILPGGNTEWTGYSHLPLESLIANPPDILIIDNSYGDSPTLAQTVLIHPVLRELDQQTLRVSIPNRVWLCGIPDIVQAMEDLAKVRHLWSARRGVQP